MPGLMMSRQTNLTPAEEFWVVKHSHDVVGAVELSESAIIILSPVAMDEMFELFDNKLLITDNTFHHVANRNYTD